MRSLSKMMAAAAMAAAMCAVPLAHAGEDVNPDAFVKMCDKDKDGLGWKAEAMKAVEKMFDKVEAKKMGKLDKRQVEVFLKELMKGGG